MGNTSAKEPSMFARLMADRGHADAKQWMAFSKRMSKLDTVWPKNGAQSTKFLRGLVERQKGRVRKSDQVFLQHIETLVQERDTKAHTQATQAAARVARNKRPSAVLRKGNPNVYDTSSISDTEDVYLAQGTGAPNNAHALHDIDGGAIGAGVIEGAVGKAGTAKYDSLDAEKRSLKDKQKDLDKRLEKFTAACITCDDTQLRINRQLQRQVEDECREVRHRLREIRNIEKETSRAQLPVRIIPVGEGNAEREMHRIFTPSEIAALKQGIPDFPKEAHRFDDWLDQTVATYQCNEQDLEQLAIGVMPWALSQAAKADAQWANGNVRRRIDILKIKAQELYPIVREWSKITEVRPRDNETPHEFLIRFRPIFHLHSGIPAANADVPLAAHFLAAWPDKLVDKLKSHTPDWQHKNAAEICTLLAHFKRVKSDKDNHTRATRRQAFVHTIPPAYHTAPNPSYGQPPAYQQSKPQQPPRTSLYPSLEDDSDVCFYCRKKGHWKSQCPNRPAGSRGRGRPARGRPT